MTTYSGKIYINGPASESVNLTLKEHEKANDWIDYEWSDYKILQDLCADSEQFKAMQGALTVDKAVDEWNKAPSLHAWGLASDISWTTPLPFSLPEINFVALDSDSFEGQNEIEQPTYTEEATDDCPWAFEYPKELDDKDFQPNQEWPKYWEVDTNIDPAQSAADFYILTGIIDKAFSEHFDDLTLPAPEAILKAGRKLGVSDKAVDERIAYLSEYAESKPENKLTELTKRAELMHASLVSHVSESFRQYCHMACGGELRHHKAITSLSTVRKKAWIKWYFIYEKYGVDALPQMEQLFLEFSGGAFGGKAWANAANILYMYETNQLSTDSFMNKALFVDRVFNLEHNGGCFLNKLSWSNHRLGRDKPYNYQFTSMKDYVLAAHAKNPIDLNMLYAHASEDVQKLCAEYMEDLQSLGYPIMVQWKESTGNMGKTSLYAGGPKVKKQPVTGVIDWSEEEALGINVSIDTSPAQGALEKITAILEKNK